ncbi:MAG: TetR/AcrR family transcriptional regulator [Candidatus Lokiarchaeota archaeon]|nr:TetR/AcrR family transcriptional regulator [Candidatus Lokiarchaeota archaeon]
MNSSNKEKLSRTRLRREKEREQKRLKIIAVAEKLFFSQSFDNTTMEQIAYESEFSKGTLYNYFRSKDELYIAIGVKAYELIIQYTIDFTKKHDLGLRQLMAIGYAYYEFTKDYPNFASIFHDISLKVPNIISKSKNEISEIEDQYLKLGNSYWEIMFSILDNAIKNKKIRADKDPSMIAYVLATLTKGLIEDLMQTPEIIKREFKMEPDKIIDFTFELLGDGLKPRE